MEHDVVIIGGGASGLTAAQMLAGESLRVALVSEGSLAGDLPNLEWLNDFPRDGHRVQGSEFAARLIDDAQAAGVRFIEGRVQELESYSSSHAAVLTNGRALTATFMVLAPGRKRRQIEAMSLDQFKGRGLIDCAACEAVFYRGQSVVVCGGGQGAVVDALHLARFAAAVTLVEQGAQLNCGADLEALLKSSPNIRVLRATLLTGASGSSGLELIQLRDSSGSARSLAAQGLVVQVGRTPATDFLINTVGLDARGYIEVDERMQTDVPNVFAIGDARCGARFTVSNAVADARTVANAIRASHLTDA
ncbi:NAD(P)/FAD-dependent oxidoreductase [Variovorax sp. LjRoot290]|uniref:NAD(P)/FAD-dependent oxidoreductase n=1 Tax=Variovorax sp. LjRoot290 TaxID=3342316 RepID=UPI003ECD36CF